MIQESGFERAKRLFPGGSQTLSKSYVRYPEGFPRLVVAAYGSNMVCDDGKQYLDFGMALGACILGYGNSRVDEAIKDQLGQGINFSLPSILEGEVAEQTLSYVPWAEQLRFAKNGSDVTDAAVRIARALTGRNNIIMLKNHYSGWHDSLVSHTHPEGVLSDNNSYVIQAEPSVEGVQDAFNYFGYREPIERRGVAAVILEPLPASGVRLDKDFLQFLREITKISSSLLIFDEVFCGFRYRMGSAEPDVEPDLACFGKAIANGMPLAALVGKREFMKALEPGHVFFSGTAGGECLSLAACKATLKVMDKPGFHVHLDKLGSLVQENFNRAAIDAGAREFCTGDGPRTVVAFLGQRRKEAFQLECLKRGLLFHGWHNMSYAHTKDDVDLTAVAYWNAFQAIKDIPAELGADSLFDVRR